VYLIILTQLSSSSSAPHRPATTIVQTALDRLLLFVSKMCKSRCEQSLLSRKKCLSAGLCEVVAPKKGNENGPVIANCSQAVRLFRAEAPRRGRRPDSVPTSIGLVKEICSKDT